MKTFFSGLAGERRNRNATTEFNDVFYNLMITVNSLAEESSLAGILSGFAQGSREDGAEKTEAVWAS